MRVGLARWTGAAPYDGLRDLLADSFSFGILQIHEELALPSALAFV